MALDLRVKTWIQSSVKDIPMSPTDIDNENIVNLLKEIYMSDFEI
jgi:hypothetical protein